MKNKKKFFVCLLTVLAILFMVVLIIPEVDARAGSGNYYKSSSGGSSSSRSSGGISSSRSSRSSRSSGSFDADDAATIAEIIRFIVWLIELCFKKPLIGIPLVCLIIFGFKLLLAYIDREAIKNRKEWLEKLVKNCAASSAPIISQIQTVDPNFKAEEFSERVKKAFTAIQESWSKRDLSNVEALFSDGTYEQFSVQIEDYKRNHVIDHMEQLNIQAVEYLSFDETSGFSRIDIKIYASSINYRIDDQTNTFKEGSTLPEDFSEVWTFIRKIGVKTSGKPGLIEGQCPNCGNPIEIGRLTTCKVCGSMLRSGEYDWVLTKITQSCEWHKPLPADKIEGYKEFKHQDEGFTPYHIEDIATVIFWRKTIAERTKDFSYLRKAATDDFTKSAEEKYKEKSLFSKFTGLAAVRMISIESGQTDDKVYVDLIWGGIPMLYSPDFEFPISVGEYKNKREIYVLTRKHGSQTNNSNALNSAHCPNCGAPESGTGNECEYCGTVLNSGEKEWVLCDIIPPKKEKSSNSSNKTEYSLSSIEIIRWAIAMMAVDGKIDDNEMAFLRSLAKKYDISEKKLDETINEFVKESNPVEYAFMTTGVSNPRKILKALAKMALADGVVTDEENKMLKEFAIRNEIPPEEFNEIIQRIKSKAS